MKVNVLHVLLGFIVMGPPLQLLVARDITANLDPLLLQMNVNQDFIVRKDQQHSNHVQLEHIHQQQDQSHVPIVLLVVFVNPMPMVALEIPMLHVLVDIIVQQKLVARYYVLLELMVQIEKDFEGSLIVLIVLLDIIVILLIMALLQHQERTNHKCATLVMIA